MSCFRDAIPLPKADKNQQAPTFQYNPWYPDLTRALNETDIIYAEQSKKIQRFSQYIETNILKTLINQEI